MKAVRGFLRWRPVSAAARWTIAWGGVGLLLVVSNLLWLGVTLGYGALHSRVEIRVHAADDGRIVAEPGLDEAVLSDAALRHWVVMATVEVFTVGYHDVEHRRAQWRRYFTDRGYRAFVGQRAEALRRVREGYQVVAAKARGAPEIVERAVVDGRRIWRIRLPVRITARRAGGSDDHEDGVARIGVVRVPFSGERPGGIAISDLRLVEGVG